MEIVRHPVLFEEDTYTVEVKLEDGTSHVLGRFSDDAIAIKAVKAFEEREFGVKEKVHKAKTPFDHINAFYRKENLFESMTESEFEVNNKAYTQFIINRGLSMNPENAILINSIGHMDLPNFAHASYCSQAMTRPSRWSKWVKESKKDKRREEKIQSIMEELNYSRERAEEALGILDL